MVVFAELPYVVVGAQVWSADGKSWNASSDRSENGWLGQVQAVRFGVATIHVTQQPDPVDFQSGSASAIPIRMPTKVSVGFRES